MAEPAEGKRDREVAVKLDGSSTDERAEMKTKINNIWEELNGKDLLPVKKGFPKAQKAVKLRKPCKTVPSWMASLGLAPLKGSVPHKAGQIQSDQLLKSTNGDASNGLPKGSPVISGQVRVRAKVNEVLSRPSEKTDSTTKSKVFEDIKDSKSARTLRRKSETQASSSSGLDNLLLQISKKQKPNILDRSRKDWGQFKEEKGLEDDLEAYKKSGDKYLDKIAFLQRSDVREYEKERDARLSIQPKRQSETVSFN